MTEYEVAVEMYLDELQSDDGLLAIFEAENNIQLNDDNAEEYWAAHTVWLKRFLSTLQERLS